MEPVKIVARYMDGTMIKGHTQNFHPNKPTFYLYGNGCGTSEKPTELRMEGLKAVFFVKTFDGNPQNNERKCFQEDDRPAGRKVQVTFVDGEIMQGSTLGYNAQRQGFFLFPVDKNSNNIRVFALTAAISEFRCL
jgi:hypothetical protein